MKRSGRLKRFPFLAVLISSVLLAAVVLFLERVEQPVEKRTLPKAKEPETPKQPAILLPLPPVSPEEKHEGRKIAIIIDDIGFDLRVVEELAEMKAPIAFAVLPFTPHAAKAAERLHAAGKEILLHLPMEPHSYPKHNPGEGALFTGMTGEAIRKQVATDLAAVPYVSGVNNHMGSRFMEDKSKLAIVMEELMKRGLFFVDSRTTPRSGGREAAAKAGVRFAARAVFIDHEKGYDNALQNLTHLAQPGSGRPEPLLLIGHPRPGTVRALREVLPAWRNGGVQVISISTYMEGAASGEKLASGRKNLK